MNMCRLGKTSSQHITCCWLLHTNNNLFVCSAWWPSVSSSTCWFHVLLHSHRAGVVCTWCGFILVIEIWERVLWWGTSGTIFCKKIASWSPPFIHCYVHNWNHFGSHFEPLASLIDDTYFISRILLKRFIMLQSIYKQHFLSILEVIITSIWAIIGRKYCL